MKTLKLFALLLAAAAAMTFTSCEEEDGGEGGRTFSETIDFESVALGGGGYINDKLPALDSITFYNKFLVWEGEATSWEGFAFSCKTDTLDASVYTNDCSVYAGGGAYGSRNFAVFYAPFGETPRHIQLPGGAAYEFGGVMVNNSTVTYRAIRDGNNFAKKFEEGDWFKVVFTGYNAAGEQEGSVEFYLADFRDGKKYICAEWTPVSLVPLGKVNAIDITFGSSDKGEFGINTPQYVCLDNLTYLRD